MRITMKTRRIARDGIMLAMLIICSQLSIPLPMVPLTMQTFAVGLVATMLPVGETLLIIATYLIIGIAGIPVFANYTGGIAIINSPMGGYLIGFLVYGLLTSGFLKFTKFSSLHLIIANVIGASAQLLIGSLWLMYFNHLHLGSALLIGFVAFIVPGIIKIGLIWAVAKQLNAIQIFQRA